MAQGGCRRPGGATCALRRSRNCRRCRLLRANCRRQDQARRLRRLGPLDDPHECAGRIDGNGLWRVGTEGLFSASGAHCTIAWPAAVSQQRWARGPARAGGTRPVHTRVLAGSRSPRDFGQPFAPGRLYRNQSMEPSLPTNAAGRWFVPVFSEEWSAALSFAPAKKNAGIAELPR